MSVRSAPFTNSIKNSRHNYSILQIMHTPDPFSRKSRPCQAKLCAETKKKEYMSGSHNHAEQLLPEEELELLEAYDQTQDRGGYDFAALLQEMDNQSQSKSDPLNKAFICSESQIMSSSSEGANNYEIEFDGIDGISSIKGEEDSCKMFIEPAISSIDQWSEMQMAPAKHKRHYTKTLNHNQHNIAFEHKSKRLNYKKMYLVNLLPLKNQPTKKKRGQPYMFWEKQGDHSSMHQLVDVLQGKYTEDQDMMERKGMTREMTREMSLQVPAKMSINKDSIGMEEQSDFIFNGYTL